MSRSSISSNRPSTAGTAQVELDDSEPFLGGYVAKTLFERRSEYLTWRSCKIKIGSWNVATSESTEKDISKWLVDEHKPKAEVKAKKTTSKIGKWFKDSIARRNSNMQTKPDGAHDEESIAVEDDDDIGIYVICLQEVIDVSATENFLKSSDSKVKKMWEKHITAALPTHTCILSQQVIGLLLFVYAIPDLATQITTTSSTSVGTGLMGYVGNKGACLARIVLGGLPAASIIPPPPPEDVEESDPLENERGLTIVFVNSHLAAFANAVDRRNWDYSEIQRRAFFHPKVLDPVVGGDTDQEDFSRPGGVQIYDADIVFWCGDLNYRLDLPNDHIRKALHPFLPAEEDGRHPPLTLQGPLDDAGEGTNKNTERNRSLQQTISELLKSDQLYEQQKHGKAFDYYQEGPINFLPTYKYDTKTVATFDSSEKVRGPSYCDRILWKVKSVAIEEAERRRSRDVADNRDKRRESFVDDGITDVLFNVGKEDGEDEDEDFEDAVEDTNSPIADLHPDIDEIDSPVTLLSYTSHQLITSSDHKPVSAEFRLEYLATSQSAKARIHAEIVKELDRNENELRPMVTVVVDNDKKNTGIAEFGDVRWGEKKTVSLTIANIGRGMSTCEFVKRPVSRDLVEEDEDSGFAKLSIKDDALAFGEDDHGPPHSAGSEEEVSREWLTAQFNSTMATDPITLEPGDAESITLEISLPPRHTSDPLALLCQLNLQKVPLQDVLVLRIAHGRDIFIPVKGRFITTYLGFSLTDLLRIPENSGGLRGNFQTLSKNDFHWSAPRELFRITEYLLTSIRSIAQSEGGQGVRWTMLPGWPFTSDTWGLADDPQDRSKNARTTLKLWIREGLDCDREWQWQEMEEMGYTLEECVEAMAESLLEWLKYLKEGLVPAKIYSNVLVASGSRASAEKILDSLTSPTSNVHANVFIYLSGFITEMIAILSPPLLPDTALRSPTSPTKPSASSKMTTAELVKNNILQDFSQVMIRKPMGYVDKKGDIERKIKFLRWFCE